MVTAPGTITVQRKIPTVFQLYDDRRCFLQDEEWRFASLSYQVLFSLDNGWKMIEATVFLCCKYKFNCILYYGNVDFYFTSLRRLTILVFGFTALFS